MKTLVLFALLCANVHAEGLPRSVDILARSSDYQATPYLAFPAVVDLGHQVLVSFKMGRSHAADPGAALGLIRLDGATGEVVDRTILAQAPNQIMQMGEWVRFGNGDLANCIDAQQKEAPTRLGLRIARSTDGGRTFGPLERAGAIDGVEYGYAFDALTRGQSTWMLAMTFGNLRGGKEILKTKSQPGSVDIIRTDDYGKSWHFVRSVTQELQGAPINESCFAAHGQGYLLAARGYDKRQWLCRMDAEFHVAQAVDLAAENSFIRGVIGRPRLFCRDGGCYLLARNFTGEGGNHMRLSLFKFDPRSLAITRHVALDNAEDADVTDGYYAAPYWRETNVRTEFNVITYKRLGKGQPDIIRLAYDWEAVK